MQRSRIGSITATAAIVLGCFLAAAPVSADALYPSGGGGTWDFNDACDDAPWTRTYSLWYILNDGQDYLFDIPDPDLTPGETVTVKLSPTVVGTLHGSVSLTGADTITGPIPPTNPHPGDTMWQDQVAADQTFTIVYEPGDATVGPVPLPTEWPAGMDYAYDWVGFAAVQAVITSDLGTEQTIVMLAQPFQACGAAGPTPSPTPSPTPTPSPSPSSNPDAMIRYVDPGGVDIGDCSDKRAPCATIQYAVDHLTPGETVRIAAGTYVESVNRTPGGGYTNLPDGASIVGAGPGKTIVNGPGPCTGPTNTFYIGGHRVALRSLSVGCSGYGVQAFGRVTIEDVTFLPTAGGGVDTGYGAPLIIKGSTFQGAYGVGIRGGDVTISGSTFETTTVGVGRWSPWNPSADALTLRANRFPGDGTALRFGHGGVGPAFGPMDLADNWWGCNGGPGAAGCATIVGAAGVPGAEHVESWLRLEAIDPPAALAPRATAPLTFGLVSSATGRVATAFPAAPVAFSATVGSIKPTTAVLADGLAMTSFRAPDEAGIYTVTATLDQGIASVELNAPVPPTPTPSPVPTPSPGDASGPSLTLPPTSSLPAQDGGPGGGAIPTPAILLGAFVLALIAASLARKIAKRRTPGARS